MRGTLTLDLVNDAPTDGEPGYVINNLVGLPVGTNRTWVSIFTRSPVTAVHLNGEPITSEPGSEAGYFVTSTFVVLPSAESAQLTFEMEGPLDVADGYGLQFRTPPVVGTLPVEVNATWFDEDGMSHRIDEQLDRPGLHRADVTDADADAD
jgi:hypothetical protein